MKQPRIATALFIVLAAAAGGIAGCASSPPREGLEVAKLPAEIQADYAVFARRCSKCHPLARALNSGITEDSLWVDYVTRMRRQPGSGISREDTVPILRFLHYYSLDQRQKKHDRDVDAGKSSAPSAHSASELPGGRNPGG